MRWGYIPRGPASASAGVGKLAAAADALEIDSGKRPAALLRGRDDAAASSGDYTKLSKSRRSELASSTTAVVVGATAAAVGSGERELRRDVAHRLLHTTRHTKAAAPAAPGTPGTTPPPRGLDTDKDNLCTTID